MRLPPSRRQWARFSLPSKISVLGAFSSILAMILSIAFYFIQPSISTDINQKIKELDEIKRALTTLSSYVDTQQKRLKDLSSEKITLEKEREKIEKVLEIDKEKLNALLEYQLAQGRSRSWLEILLSFSVGVLSSSIVTFSAIAIQNRRKSKKVAGHET